MKQTLINVLETFGYDVYLQGTLTDSSKYPKSFFTFYNNDTSDSQFYDNSNHRIEWDFDINFYSTDTHLVNTVLVEVKALLKSKGFIINGVGRDIPSDSISHTGRNIKAIAIQNV